MSIFLKKNICIIISVSLCITFALIYSYQSIKLYDAHKTRGDLANFAQAMWNTTQGRIMQNSFNYSIHNFWGDRKADIQDNSNIFGIHFNPILFLFVPFYFLYSHPQTLLIIQSLLVAAAGFLVFLIAKRELKHNIVALTFQVIFLMNFAVISAVLSEFHAFALSIFFGLLIIYVTKFKNHYLYYSCLILFFFVQENTPVATVFYGIYLMFNKEDRKRGIITSTLSFIYFFAVIKIIIPSLSNYHHYLFESIYGNPLGSTIVGILIGAIKHPILLVQTIFTKQNMIYLSKIYMPFFPLFLLSPGMFLVSLSGLASNILSTDQLLKSISMHYESLAIPFLVYSSVLGLKNILSITKQKFTKYIIPMSMMGLLLLTFIEYKKFTFYRLNKTLLFQPLYSDRDRELDMVIQKIPASASVATQDYISGHLTTRRKLYLFPVYFDKVDYLLLATDDSIWPLEQKEHQMYINKILKDKKHTVVYQSPRFMLIKKK